MAHSERILFVVQNDHFPQDSRVFNECRALSEMGDCWVVAPHAAGQSWRETVEGIRCLRFPTFMADSVRGIFLEYLISLFWLATIIPTLVILKGIRVIHVANPPDFIIPSVGWLKLVGVKVVYDMHDLSTETFRAKLGPKPGHLRHLLPPLAALERWSLKLSDLMVSTNDSILERARRQHPDVKSVVVRNSNPIIHTAVEQVKKQHNDGRIRIGFFGLLADDPAAGLENIIAVANQLRDANCPFVMQIVGTGPGLPTLRTLVVSQNLSENFEFLGFIPIPAAYAVISTFDFGLVAWGNMPKNHLHTAMKIMDYMCCAVPVCSLNLVEQLRSTAGVGIHADDFTTLANQMISIYHDPSEYDALRRSTLAHFNEVLCWELQEQKLRGAYADMLCIADRGSVPC